MANEFLSSWWLRSLVRRRHVRSATLGLLGTAALGAGGCAEWTREIEMPAVRQDRDNLERSVDTLALQRANSWAVGVAPDDLDPSVMAMPDAVERDFDGGGSWRERMLTLAKDLAPAAALQPYYVPTLFQSLAAPSSGLLRRVMQPIDSKEMQDAYGRGRAIASLFSQVGWPRDTMIIVDLPGPEAVATAAALSAAFDPVFAFGNWPHPFGVVPAHETLAATLFFAPLFERTRGMRPAGAPPMLVLDANRLAPYGDEEDQFDNRYLAQIPSANELRELGIRHVLYVTQSGLATELDDLNEPLVDIAQAGIDVRALGMDELRLAPEAPRTELALLDSNAEDPDPGTDLEGDVTDDGWVWAFQGGMFWYFGGDMRHHCHFWDHYGWYHATGRPSRVASPALGLVGGHGCHYQPLARTTAFSGGRLQTARSTVMLRPSGFGAMRVNTSRGTGHFTGFAGHGGSFGRASGWGSG
jgi:hypothetical protein